MATYSKRRLYLRDGSGNAVTNFPVVVKNINGDILGTAESASELVELWNADPDNAATGTLHAAGDAAYELVYDLELLPSIILVESLVADGDVSATGVSKQQINLVWASKPGALTYIVKRSTDISFSDEKQVFAGNRLQYQDTGLAQNTLYYYRVYWANESTEQLIDSANATTLNAGVTYDIDAEAIIAAIEPERELVEDEKDAIDAFITALKSASIYSKMKAVYVKMWGDETANRLNWVTPIRGQMGLRTTVVGAVTHNPRKMSFAGVGGATEAAATRACEITWLVPSLHLSQDDKGYTFVIKDAPTSGSSSDDYRFGCEMNSPAVGDKLVLRGKPNGASQNDEARISGANVTGSNFVDVNLPGYYVYQRSGSTSGDVLLRKDGSDVLTSLNSSTGNPSIPVASAGYTSNTPSPNPLSYRTYGMTFFAIHESFDGTEMSAWESALTTLISTLEGI